MTATDGYKGIAADYDRLVAPASWMRDRLRRHALSIWQPGDCLLDIGGGAGHDAVFFAERGMHVTLVDNSAAMVAQAERRIDAHHVADRVDIRIQDFNHLQGLVGERRFDGVISWFAALNSAPDLGRFANAVQQLLPTGGRMLLHVLGRRPLWRIVEQMRNRQRMTVTPDRHPVAHTIHDPELLVRSTFAAAFDLRNSYGMSLLRPPTGMPTWLAPFDLWLGRRRLLVGRGDFCVLDLQRR